MKKNEIMTTVSRTFHRTGLKFKKYSPEIFVGAGIVGVVVSAVMACKATTKIDDVLAEQKANIEKTKEYVEKNGYSEKYTEEDHKKDLTIFYARSAVDLVKLYAPSVAVGSISIAMIISGHHILRKRNVALAAAYATVEKGFKEYRGRVIERFGEELDKELKYNIKAKEVEEVVKDEETGEEREPTEQEIFDRIAKALADGETVVEMKEEISDSALTAAVEKEGYTVKSVN